MSFLNFKNQELKDVKQGHWFLYVEPKRGNSYICTHKLDRRKKPIQCTLLPLYPDKYLKDKTILINWEFVVVLTRNEKLVMRD